MPRLASAREPASASRAAVPMQTGLVRLGGMRVRLALLDCG